MNDNGYFYGMTVKTIQQRHVERRFQSTPLFLLKLLAWMLYRNRNTVSVCIWDTPGTAIDYRLKSPEGHYREQRTPGMGKLPLLRGRTPAKG